MNPLFLSNGIHFAVQKLELATRNADNAAVAALNSRPSIFLTSNSQVRDDVRRYQLCPRHFDAEQPPGLRHRPCSPPSGCRDPNRPCTRQYTTARILAKDPGARWNTLCKNGSAIHLSDSIAFPRPVYESRRDDRRLHIRTYASTRSVPTLTPSKPTLPRLASRSPASSTRDAISPKRLPTASRLGLRPAPGKISKGHNSEEDMLPGVRATEKEKDKKARRLALEDHASDKRLRQCQSDCRRIIEQIAQMSDEISKTIGTARLLGRIDYHLRKHQEVGTSLAHNSRSLTALSHETLGLGARWINRLSQQCVRTIELRFENFEDAMTDLDIECVEFRDRVLFEVLKTRRYYLREASSIIRVTRDLKDFDGQNSSLWNGINAYGAALIDLVRFINTELKPSMPCVDRATSERIYRIWYLGNLVARPFGPRGSDSTWNVPLLGLAHDVRSVELNMHLSRHLPSITFADRWATSLKHQHSMLLRDDLFALQGIVTAIVEGSVHPERIVRRNRNFRGSRMTKLKRLVPEILSVVRKLSALASMLDRMLGSGCITLCPHPEPTFYRRQLRAVRPIQAYDIAWKDLEATARDVGDAVNMVCSKFKQVLHSDSLESRRHLVDLLDLTYQPPPSSSHPLSRRGNIAVRREFMVWYSTRLLYDGFPETDTQGSTNLHNLMTSLPDKAGPPFMLPSKTQYRPAINEAWLENTSLYPRKGAIMIDYICTRETLVQAIGELWHERVIGLYVSPALNGVLSSRISNIVIASKSNVYVLDCQALSGPNDWRYFTTSLKDILENPSVLKVGFDIRSSAELMWSVYAIDVIATFNLAQQQATNAAHPFPSILRMLEAAFDCRALDLSSEPVHALRDGIHKLPIRYFHRLAMQAYGPLRIFCAAINHKTVRTTDTNVSFDVEGYIEQVAQYNTDDFELGPINIDRSSTAFGLRTKGVPSTADLKQNARSRSVFMRQMALTTARQFIHDHPHRNMPEPLPEGADTSPPYLEQRLAAYFLATTFGERLDAIERYLLLQNAAAWILWTATVFHLRLNPEDSARYKEAALPNPHLSISASSLNEYKPFGRSQPGTGFPGAAAENDAKNIVSANLQIRPAKRSRRKPKTIVQRSGASIRPDSTMLSARSSASCFPPHESSVPSSNASAIGPTSSSTTHSERTVDMNKILAQLKVNLATMSTDHEVAEFTSEPKLSTKAVQRAKRNTASTGRPMRTSVLRLGQSRSGKV